MSYGLQLGGMTFEKKSGQGFVSVIALGSLNLILAIWEQSGDTPRLAELVKSVANGIEGVRAASFDGWKLITYLIGALHTHGRWVNNKWNILSGG